MKRRDGWLVVLVCFVSVQLMACSSTPALAIAEAKPVSVEHLAGAEPTRLTLTEEAAKRLDLQTATAGDVTIDGTKRVVIPYAAIIYDTQGNTWTYTNPLPLTFLRRPITVERIDGDQAILAGDLAAGTLVVIVGAEELFGSESEFQEE